MTGEDLFGERTTKSRLDALWRELSKENPEKLYRRVFGNLEEPQETAPALTPFEELTLTVSTKEKESVHARRNGFPGSKTTRFPFKQAEERKEWLAEKLRMRARGEHISIHAFGRYFDQDLKLAVQVIECCSAYSRCAGKRPTMHHVVAMMLMHPGMGGPDDPQVKRSVMLMSTELLGSKRLARGSSIFWSGNARSIAAVIGQRWESPEGEEMSIFSAAIEILKSKPGEMFLSTEIIERLYPNQKRPTAISQMSIVFEILSAGGMVVRQPDYRLDEGNPKSSWSLANGVYRRAPANSPMLRVLEHAALNRGGWLLDITSSKDQKGSGYFYKNALNNAAGSLVKLGLVRHERAAPNVKPVPPPSRRFLNGRKIGRVVLTEPARKIVTDWANIPVGGSLSARSWEPIRKALVNGQPLNGNGFI